MGHEDRDYMREAFPGRSAERRSNPLWWLLGLIAVILVVGAVRRGSLQQPDSRKGLSASTGPLKVCKIQFAVDSDPGDDLLRLLKSFFREHGYDSMIHETADGSMSSASFEHRSRDEQALQRFTYHRVSGNHERLKVKHHLLGLVLHAGVGAPGVLIDETLMLAEELRLHVEQELPGIVTQVDHTPEPMSYEDFE